MHIKRCSLIYRLGLLTVPSCLLIIESFRFSFMVNVNDEQCHKYHVILATGNVHREFLLFLTFGTSFHRSRIPLRFFSCKKIPFNVFRPYMFSSISWVPEYEVQANSSDVSVSELVTSLVRPLFCILDAIKKISRDAWISMGNKTRSEVVSKRPEKPADWTALAEALNSVFSCKEKPFQVKG